MIRSPALSSRRMIRASMSPVSSGTSRAAARSPTVNVSLVPGLDDAQDRRRLRPRPGDRAGERQPVLVAADPLDDGHLGKRRGGDKAPIGGARDRAGALDLAQHVAQFRAIARRHGEGAGNLALADRGGALADERRAARPPKAARRGVARIPRPVVCPDSTAHAGCVRGRWIAGRPADCSGAAQCSDRARGVFAVDRLTPVFVAAVFLAAPVFFAVLVVFVTSVARHSWRPLLRRLSPTRLWRSCVPASCLCRAARRAAAMPRRARRCRDRRCAAARRSRRHG